MKVHQYEPIIKNGLPPKRVKTEYSTKMFGGALMEAAERIQHGQYVEDLSAGSAGKFAKRVKARNLEALVRRGQGESRGTVYVVLPEWLANNPDV